jgi:Flp pilus assembly protein TadD
MSTDASHRSLAIRRCLIGGLCVCTVWWSSGCASTARAVRSPARVPTASAPARDRPISSIAGSRIETQDSVLAAALVNALVARTPGNLVAVAYRYYQLGIRDTAMDYYSNALALDRTYAPALDGTARIWRDWGEMTAALGDAHRAVYFAPKAAEAWNTLGTVLQILERNTDAAAAYRQAIRLEVGAAYARNNLCYLAFVSGDGDQALEQCGDALRTDSRFVPARNNLALVFAAGGDWDSARREFSRAGSDATAQYNVGILLMATRQYAAAARTFDLASAADPGLAAAHARAADARRRAIAGGTSR